MIERRAITDRDTWLAWRKADLTASDLGAVAGLDPWRTALQVYAEKAGLIQTSENNIMRRGRWLEAAVMAAIREQHPELTLKPAGVYLRDPELRLGASPDCVAVERDDPDTLINLQLKVVARPTFERDWPDDTVPTRYQLQTLAEAMLLDAPRNMIAALVLDTYSADLVLREVPRHAGAERRIGEIARQFWDNIEAGRRPPADYERDAETIAQLYPHADKDRSIDLTGDNRLADLLPARAMLKAEHKGLEEQIAAMDTEIKDKLGAAEQASLPGWRLSWREETRKAYTVASSTRRVLRVSQAEEKAA